VGGLFLKNFFAFSSKIFGFSGKFLDKHPCFEQNFGISTPVPSKILEEAPLLRGKFEEKHCTSVSAKISRAKIFFGIWGVIWILEKNRDLGGVGGGGDLRKFAIFRSEGSGVIFGKFAQIWVGLFLGR